MIEIRKTDVFVDWLDGLKDIRARARVLVRIERLAAGNPGDVKPVSEGVSELRINYGPGYRVYFKKGGRNCLYSWPEVTKAPRPKISKQHCVSLGIFRRT